MNDIFARF